MPASPVPSSPASPPRTFPASPAGGCRRTWPSRVAAAAMVAVLGACGGGGGGGGSSSTDGATSTTSGTTTAGDAAAQPGLLVSLTAKATDPEGQTLGYQWRVSSGTLDRTDGPTVAWRLPEGRGLYFAYVQVSDGNGGYVERQIPVSPGRTDVVPQVAAAASIPPPAATLTAGVLIHGVVTWAPCTDADIASFNCGWKDQFAGDVRRFYLPGVKVSTSPNLQGATATTDAKGQFRLPPVPPGNYTVYCAWPGQTTGIACGSAFASADGNYDVAGLSNTTAIVPPQGTTGHNVIVFGNVSLADGSGCGMRNAFFGTQAGATVELLVDGVRVAGPVDVNAYLNYAISARVTGASRPVLRARCEGAAVIDQIVPVNVARYTAVVSGNAALQLAQRDVVFPNRTPAVTEVTALAGGAPLAVGLSPVALNLPSDQVASPDAFLSFKGLDSRQGACQYYRSIGAVEQCDANGQPTRAISFEDWKRARKLVPYNGSLTELNATYVNLRDLGFVRRMRAIQAGPNDIAYVVCNYPGPVSESQSAVDAAIQSAQADRQLAACVAMDYSALPGVNGGQPFTKFYVFGPGGTLQLSVNLDGRREKFVPGNCVVCHGGDRYAKAFPADGSGNPDLGARFLPFDLANFAFSTQAGLRELDQNTVLRQMNQLLLQTNPTQNARDLIAGWYPGANATFNRKYLPSGWAAAKAEDQDFYRNTIAPACRTCHVNHTVATYFFETQAPAATGPRYSATRVERMKTLVYGGTGRVHANQRMPNALVTYNHFWDSQFGTAQNMASLSVQFGNLIGEQGYQKPDSVLGALP